MRKSHVAPGALILMIILAASSDCIPVLQHYLAQFDGVVAARTDDVRFPPWTRNRATKYVIRDSDGRDHVYYADSIQGHWNGYPIGTSLSKERWHMDYKEGSRTRDDFPHPMYIVPMMLDALFLGLAVILAIMIHVRDNRNRELEAAFQRAKQRLETDE